MRVTAIVGLCCPRHGAYQRVETIDLSSSWTYSVVLWVVVFLFLIFERESLKA